MNYTYNYQITFDDCDPAGILFFANTWDICHRAYESWLLSLNSEWKFWFQNQDWAIPIVHSHADFLAPIKPGTKIQISLQVEHLGNSSFTTSYSFFEPSKDLTKKLIYCRISHVFVSRDSFKKIPIPDQIVASFKDYHEQ